MMKIKSVVLSSLIAMSVLFPSLSFADTSYDYLCNRYGQGPSEHEMTLELTVSARSAHADIIEETWDDFALTAGGPLDTTYSPRGGARNVRFGRGLIVEEVMLTGGKRLRDGRYGGFVRVEGEAEGGFFQFRFVCRRR